MLEQDPELRHSPGVMNHPGTYSLDQLDAVDFLRTLPSSSVNLVVTDPPYESLEKHRAIGTTTRLKHSKSSSNDWFDVFPNERFPELLTEVHRVLTQDSHFYLFCDQETMFVVKPMAEKAGFTFWKPLVWDKCLGPDTLVRTQRGVVPAASIVPGDRVYTPDERSVCVLASRKTRARAVRIALSTGASFFASLEHKFLLTDGREVEAAQLRPGSTIASGRVTPGQETMTVSLETFFDEEDRVVEMPDPSACLFCHQKFDSARAAAAHQARFCEGARSKASMAEALGVAPKRLRRWMSEGRLPAAWASQLGLSELATGRSQIRLQNDLERWFPEELKLDYGWGKLIGLYAAEGSRSELNVSFAVHRDEKHLQRHVLRTVRALGINATITETSIGGVMVNCGSKILSRLIGHFVGGTDAITKHFLPAVFAAPIEFQRGVFDGLIEGDGHWSPEERRETLNLASVDLAAYALRFARFLGWEATIHRHENAHAGFYRVRFDPAKRAAPITVASVEEAGEMDLVDIAIDDPAQLYQLHDGAVTHNCKIGMGYHYRARYEFILFFEKGKRKLSNLGVADVISVPRIFKGYPTEKPSEVSRILIEQSSQLGDLVVDPFCGSSSVGAAAVSLGRRYYGNDRSQAALDLSRERLDAAGGILAPLTRASTPHPSAARQLELLVR